VGRWLAASGTALGDRENALNPADKRPAESDPPPLLEGSRLAVWLSGSRQAFAASGKPSARQLEAIPDKPAGAAGTCYGHCGLVGTLDRRSREKRKPRHQRSAREYREAPENYPRAATRTGRLGRALSQETMREKAGERGASL
jgi:hypothetical protein